LLYQACGSDLAKTSGYRLVERLVVYQNRVAMPVLRER
jgi:hypothetical protein